MCRQARELPRRPSRTRRWRRHRRAPPSASGRLSRPCRRRRARGLLALRLVWAAAGLGGRSRSFKWAPGRDLGQGTRQTNLAAKPNLGGPGACTSCSLLVVRRFRRIGSSDGLLRIRHTPPHFGRAGSNSGWADAGVGGVIRSSVGPIHGSDGPVRRSELERAVSGLPDRSSFGPLPVPTGPAEVQTGRAEVRAPKVGRAGPHSSVGRSRARI